MRDQLSLLWFCIRSRVVGIIVLATVAWLLSGCANHCRIDQRVPEGATFEDAERLKREDCK